MFKIIKKAPISKKPPKQKKVLNEIHFEISFNSLDLKKQEVFKNIDAEISLLQSKYKVNVNKRITNTTTSNFHIKCFFTLLPNEEVTLGVLNFYHDIDKYITELKKREELLTY